MLEMMNRYIHGYVAIPVILACREKGFFKILQQKGPLSLKQLSLELAANEGYLQVALRMFESLEWLKINSENLYESVIDAECYNQIESIPIDILSLYRIPTSLLLKKNSHEKQLCKWLKYLLKNLHKSAHLIIDFLEGVVIIPLLIALKQNESLNQSNFSQNHFLTHLSPEVQQHILAFFTLKGWLIQQNGHIELTAAGRYMMEHAYNTATAASYAPMLAKIEEILFGNAKKVFKRDAKGHEQHIDRTLNVIASGFQHGHFFEDIESIIFSLFNHDNYEQQPHSVIDMGCGDGTLLKKIYRMIADHTKRGRVLSQYPLSMIGVDFNQKALEETKRTLSDIPHYTMQGDISDPESLLLDLKSLGIETESALHIRSFLDHDRPFVAPKQTANLSLRSHIPYEGIYVDQTSNALTPAFAVQGLVEHLKRWSSITSKYGLIILEVHHLRPDTVAAYFDESESFYFDALHAFSQQQLVEAKVFLLAAAEAGLFAKSGLTKRYPSLLPYTRITLNCFEKKPYTLHNASYEDIPFLIQLEEKCWTQFLRLSEEEIRLRIDRFPEGQFTIKMYDQTVGIIYTQRIEDSSLLKHTPYQNISSLHHANGRFLQLLSINVDPALQGQGLSDQLLEFVLQWSSIQGNIEKVVGVTRCLNYKETSNMTLQDYIQKHEQHPQGIDPVLRFHTSHGAKIVEVISNYRPEDRDNQGAGILIENGDLQ